MRMNRVQKELKDAIFILNLVCKIQTGSSSRTFWYCCTSLRRHWFEADMYRTYCPQLQLYGNVAIVPQNWGTTFKSARGNRGWHGGTRQTFSRLSLMFPMPYLPRQELDLNETNANTSHMHTLCLVRRSWASQLGVACLVSGAGHTLLDEEYFEIWFEKSL